MDDNAPFRGGSGRATRDNAGDVSEKQACICVSVDKAHCFGMSLFAGENDYINSGGSC